MRIKKFIILSFIVVLFVLFIIPVVSAEKEPNVITAKAISARLPPELKFNYVQEKVAISGELSPGKKIIASPSLATIQSKPSKIVTIPLGSIIYHKDNTTTLFDNNGNQLLIVDDFYAQKVHTFKGDMPSTFIHEVPNNSLIVNNGDSLHVFHDDTEILTIISDDSDESYIPVGPLTCSGSDYPPEWIVGTEANLVSSSVGRFSANWNVPDEPYQNKPGRPVFIWNGLYSCVPDSLPDGLVQPVLEWNVNTDSWSMAVWYVWSDETIWPNNDCIISDRVSGTISSGDQIQGNIQIDQMGYDAIASITDLGPGSGGATLYLTENSAPTRMSSDNLYAEVVLEASWDPSEITNTNAEYLPTPVTFKNFILIDDDEYNLIPTTTMTNFKNSLYWNEDNFPDAEDLTVYNRWPSDITLVNNRDRVNPPVADFTTTVPAGVGLAYVPFQDLSTNSPFLWHWNFGDGDTSEEKNPFHLYLIPGTYTVDLTVWNAGGIDSETKSNYIIVLPFPPVSSFIVNSNSGNAPLTVQFTDTSTGDPTTWMWDFGDGETSTLRNVSHTYTSSGVFSATLTAGNSGGNTSTSQTITVYPNPPISSFTASPTFGYKPLTVQFNDTSTYSPTNWSWDFGDGTTSSEQNPLHTFSTAGNYTINLTATNAGGSDSFVRTAYITVMPRSIVSAGSVNITQPGGEASLLLTLDSAPDGLGGYNLNLTISNLSVAQVTAVSFPEWASSMNYNSPLPSG